jgi:hypothetical protein
MAYLTAQQAEDRLLSRFGIDAALLPGHADTAGTHLESLAPFRGFALTDDPLPAPVLDWLALEAYELAVNEEPGVASQSTQHLGSKTYATPKLSNAARLQRGLLRPYLSRPALRTVAVERG